MATITPTQVTLWMLLEEGGDAEFFGKVDVRGASTLETLRRKLESNDILDWPFHFWDADDKFRVRKKVERMNGFGAEVHVIRVPEEDIDSQKRRRLELNTPTQPTGDVLPAAENEDGPEGPTADPVSRIFGSSRMGGSTESCEVGESPLKSKLLPKDVMDRYLERAKKLRVELSRVALSDHDWWLKSYDLNGNGVVKLWCGECKRDCGGGSGDHSKAQIDNLFNNFRRSHIVSTNHVRNFCAANNIDFNDHPQSHSKNGRSVTLLPEDHRRLIDDGVEIVTSVNTTLPDGHKPFTILGNLEAEDTRCYWFKVRCQYCRDMMVMCPVKKNLDANLKNHVTGL